MATNSTANQLEELSRQLAILPSPNEPPPTILQVIGRAQIEQDWQRLFFHYLNPESSHRLGDSLLEHILSALADRDDLAFTYSRFDLPDVHIAQEVQTSVGRPDAVCWVTDDWFICWELKVLASEGTDQTQRYVDVPRFDGPALNKMDYRDNGHHYFYLAPANAPPPHADAFEPITWEWIATEIQSFLERSHGEHPARTTAQLEEFVGLIRSELVMTEYGRNQHEKAGLYVDYVDAIGTVQDAFDSIWSEFTKNWATRLANSLDLADIVEIPRLPDQHVAVDIEGQRWIFQQGHSDWGGITRDRWWRETETLSMIYEQADNGEDARITLYHRLDLNREEALREHTLELQLWHGSKNDAEFMEVMRENVRTALASNERPVPASIRLAETGKILTTTYDIPIEEHDDFLDAYISALRDAVLDIVVEHPAMVQIIDEAYHDALTMYE